MRPGCLDQQCQSAEVWSRIWTAYGAGHAFATPFATRCTRKRHEKASAPGKHSPRVVQHQRRAPGACLLLLHAQLLLQLGSDLVLRLLLKTIAKPACNPVWGARSASVADQAAQVAACRGRRGTPTGGQAARSPGMHQQAQPSLRHAPAPALLRAHLKSVKSVVPGRSASGGTAATGMSCPLQTATWRAAGQRARISPLQSRIASAWCGLGAGVGWGGCGFHQQGRPAQITQRSGRRIRE